MRYGGGVLLGSRVHEENVTTKLYAGTKLRKPLYYSTHSTTKQLYDYTRFDTRLLYNYTNQRLYAFGRVGIGRLSPRRHPSTPTIAE